MTSDSRGRAVRLVFLCALLAALLAIPSTATADEQGLHKAKKSFGQAWKVVTANFDPLALQTRAYIGACDNAAAIDDPYARANAFFLLQPGVTDVIQRADLFQHHRDVLERRAGAILREGRDLDDPGKRVEVANAHKLLLDAIDSLVGNARANLIAALGFISNENCAAAVPPADAADGAHSTALLKKLKAFRLL